MKLVMTLLVRDEMDIIRSQLDYHLAAGIDHIIVTDNGSTDGTLDILAEYACCGLIELFHEPPSDFSQHRWVTRMARHAATAHGADWVINADADEFFLWRGGHLRDAFASIADDITHFCAPRHDFIPHAGSENLSPPIGMVFRKAVSTNLFGKPLLPKVIHRGRDDVSVAQGNHDVEFTGACHAMEGHGPIELCHYPLRSYPQFETKVRNGGSSYAKNTELTPFTGGHKRYWYKLLQSNLLQYEYYTRHFYNTDRLNEALHTGELVRDTRLAERIGLIAVIDKKTATKTALHPTSQ